MGNSVAITFEECKRPESPNDLPVTESKGCFSVNILVLLYLLLLIIPCFMALSTACHLGYHILPILNRPISSPQFTCTSFFLLMRMLPRVRSHPTTYLILWLLSHGFDYRLHAINSQIHHTINFFLSIRLYNHQPGGSVQRYPSFGMSKIELTTFHSKQSPSLVFFLSCIDTQLSKL